MALTPRLQFPYPDEFQDPWYEGFVALMNAVDSACYAAREDRNIILMGGGDVSFVAAAGTVSFSDDVYLLSAVTGYRWRIAAGVTNGVTDGKLLVLTLVRAPTGTTTLTISVADHVPNTDTALVLAVRSGARLYFRNGSVAQDGVVAKVIEEPSGGGAGTPLFPFREEFAGTGVDTHFDTTVLVDIALWPSVQVHRNGLLLDYDPLGVTKDEYWLENIDPGGGLITRVHFGAAPDLGNTLYVTGWHA